MVSSRSDWTAGLLCPHTAKGAMGSLGTQVYNSLQLLFCAHPPWTPTGNMTRRMGKAGRNVSTYEHSGEERINNPPVGLVTPRTDQDAGTKSYAHDPHLDPQLSWAGKAEHTSFEVPTISLHVHERIDPRTIIRALQKNRDTGQQLSLFDAPGENPPLRQAIEFYRHRHNWSNRLVAGDSILVMNSLLEKEGLGGQVQMVYMDPPYGIRYGSNFQPFVNRREVNDGKDADLTAEPEQIRAFRDTWELGIHSYLSYLRDRLVLTRELLHESGSCFVQIGKENVHRVGMVMDEIFGAENQLATISYATTGGSSAKTLPQVADYLLWYSKDRARVKYRQLYEPLTRREVIEFFNWDAMVELPDGECRRPTPEERFDPDKYLPSGSRLFRRMQLISPGTSTTGRSDPYEWGGRTFHCPTGQHWRVSMEGLDQLAAVGRLSATQGDKARLSWKLYESEVPGRRIHNIWSKQMSPTGKRYVVETATKVIRRCILMTTDPGDLVIDPTCGSGSTAFVAERWGRRWITCDTSRVATALAKQRLMTANFDYYDLARPNDGVGGGFSYRRVSKVSAKTLGYDEPPEEVILLDQPQSDRTKARVTGPFTVEAVPAPTVLPIDDVVDPEPLAADDSVARTGPTVRQGDWRDELLKTGIRGKSGQHIGFVRLEPLPGHRTLHAEGEIEPDKAQQDLQDSALGKRVVVSFGPDHAPMEQRQVARAIDEAYLLVPRPAAIVFTAFQFDPEASKDIDETNWPGVTLLKAQMNADLLTDDLKRKRASNESFWLIGQPDVRLELVPKKNGGGTAGYYRVSVRGFDYYNTKTGTIESGDASRIAVWMLDPDYDGRSLFPRQVFFPMSGIKDGWAKLAKSLKAEIDQDRIKAYQGTVSLPFKAGEHKRAAVKIVDDRGVESLKIVDLI